MLKDKIEKKNLIDETKHNSTKSKLKKNYKVQFPNKLALKDEIKKNKKKKIELMKGEIKKKSIKKEQK